MDSAIIVAIVKALQILLELVAKLNLTAPLFPPVRDVPNNTCFDYIVIGAGTAGCVVANRLTEDPNITVGLFEAGGNPEVQDFVPALFFSEPNSNEDWAYTGTFDPYAAQAQYGRTNFQSGKTLGGSSSINHFIVARGAPKDYESWNRIVNKNSDDESWAYGDVLPYFKKSERLEDPEIQASPFGPYHGYDGPQGISRELRKEANVYLKSFNETGSPVVEDLNAFIHTGYTQSMFTVTESVRQGTGLDYLTPIKHRLNLYVFRYSLVTKILFEGKRAVAVEVLRNGITYVYRACKEIILSAGVYNSPQLLMLSGVGPKRHLESFNIDVISDLPVGDNFQDQVAVSLLYKTAFSVALPSISLTGVPFPVILGLAALNPKQDFADYQVFGLVYGHDLPFILLTCAVVFPYRYDICDSLNAQSVGRNTLYALLTHTKPYSKGTVRLASTNPLDKPLIKPNYYRNKTDLINMRAYIKDFIKLGNASYFKDVGAELVYPELEECKKYTAGSDKYWDCYILNMSISVYHTTSTCAMGSVTDSKMRVKGVTNLRVIDASAMPHLISGSPGAVVIMMGEKGADIIKKDANKYTCNETCVVDTNATNSGGVLDKLKRIFKM